MTRKEMQAFLDEIWLNDDEAWMAARHEVEKILTALLDQTRWRSVDEELPEEGVAVLTYGDMGLPETDFGKRVGKYFQTLDGANGLTPTHWMPVPQPPEER